MATVRATDEQRLAFGRVAELYDRARPSYPTAVIDELIEFAGLGAGDRVLEVGAGTGKLTCLLAERGLAVLGLEPSAEMTEVARGNCAQYPYVEIEQVDFERWQASIPPSRLVASAQAWHWVAPELRYELAAAALESEGTLAAIWTFPDWEHTELRDGLREAYRLAAPDLEAGFPMHPASEPTDLAGDWHAEIEASGGFADPQVRIHPWSATYSTAQYMELLQTHQDHILLEPVARERLLDAIAQTIDSGGGEIVVNFVTRLCLARGV
ncbi:MAG: methyltransferase domain-containing protein [Solirubrobacteraceae bacterium]|jgi:SAM-dependent methyltransferase